MTLPISNPYGRPSLPSQLQAYAVIAYLAVFAAIVGVGRPGAGIGQGFYVPIVLASLGGTMLFGIGAGLVAALLYELGLLVSGVAGGLDLWSLRSAAHLAGYVAAGALVGYFATRARGMMKEALHVLDDLLDLARRDVDTGALDAHGFEGAVSSRIAGRTPFTLLLGELECSDRRDTELRRIVGALVGLLEGDADVARVGPAQLAVVTMPSSLGGARASAERLERMIGELGVCATFGWTVYPVEGADAWSLFRAASERLYARRIVRGEWAPTAATAGLVDELIEPAI